MVSSGLCFNPLVGSRSAPDRNALALLLKYSNSDEPGKEQLTQTSNIHDNNEVFPVAGRPKSQTLVKGGLSDAIGFAIVLMHFLQQYAVCGTDSP